MKQKGFVLLPVIIIIVLVGIVGYFIFQNTRINKSNNNIFSPIIAPATTNIPKASKIPSQCKKVNETICINPLICPNNEDKCCKGLIAVIETKSTALCQIPNKSNSDKPRVQRLEQ